MLGSILQQLISKQNQHGKDDGQRGGGRKAGAEECSMQDIRRYYSTKASPAANVACPGAGARSSGRQEGEGADGARESLLPLLVMLEDVEAFNPDVLNDLVSRTRVLRLA